MKVTLKEKAQANLWKLRKANESNFTEYYILEADNNVIDEGTELNEEFYEKINYNDESIMGLTINNEVTALPNAKALQAQIVLLPNGEIWVVPPQNKGVKYKLEEREVLFEGNRTLTTNKTLTCSKSLYGSGFKSMMIEVYKDNTTYEDCTDYIYEGNTRHYVEIIDETINDGDSFYNEFSFITKIDNESIEWISGNVNGNNVVLRAYKRIFSTNTVVSVSNGFHIRITGVK